MHDTGYDRAHGSAAMRPSPTALHATASAYVAWAMTANAPTGFEETKTRRRPRKICEWKDGKTLGGR